MIDSTVLRFTVPSHCSQNGVSVHFFSRRIDFFNCIMELVPMKFSSCRHSVHDVYNSRCHSYPFTTICHLYFLQTLTQNGYIVLSYRNLISCLIMYFLFNSGEYTAKKVVFIKPPVFTFTDTGRISVYGGSGS